MSNPTNDRSSAQPDALFERIVGILEEARGNLVRAVNTQMVTAYWLIGREIVEEIQGGEDRAEYGKQVVESLSARLTERYGKGFSTTNLGYFRQFYLVFPDRSPIRHPSGGESSIRPKLHLRGGESAGIENQRPPGVEFGTNEAIPSPTGTELAALEIRHPTGDKFTPAFSPLLS